MVGYGIIMIVFGVIVFLAGLYLAKWKKGDFGSVLLWKVDIRKMSISEVQYAGKVTMSVALAPIISGISAFFFGEESIIPIIVLIVLVLLLLIGSIKIFK